MALCVSFLLAACSQKTASPQESETEPSVETSIKNEEVIKAELSAWEDFFSQFDLFCFNINGDFLGSDYEIEDLTINRRKIDEEAGADDVYITVTANNGSSIYEGDFHPIYTLYDVGGWYLDTIELESGQLKPSSQVPDDEVYNIALGILGPMGASIADCSIDSHQTTSNTEETVIVTVDFNDGVLAGFGTIGFRFYYDGQSWKYMEDYSANLSLQ